MSPHATFEEVQTSVLPSKKNNPGKSATDARLHLNDGNTIPQVALGVYVSFSDPGKPE